MTFRKINDLWTCAPRAKENLENTQTQASKRCVHTHSLRHKGVHSESHIGPCTCDNKCGAKGFKFFEIAAIVSEEGGAAHTINFCRNCYNDSRVEQGEAEVNGARWRALIEHQSSRGKFWASFGVEQFLRRMWERFTIKKRVAQNNSEKETRSGTDGRWQHESLYKEELELLRHSTDLRFEGSLMRQAYTAGTSGDWTNYLEHILGNGKAQHMEECGGERMLQ